MIKVSKTKNFINLVLKIEKPLRLRRMRNLSIAGKITVFETFTISNVVSYISKGSAKFSYS